MQWCHARRGVPAAVEVAGVRWFLRRMMETCEVPAGRQDLLRFDDGDVGIAEDGGDRGAAAGSKVFVVLFGHD